MNQSLIQRYNLAISRRDKLAKEFQILKSQLKTAQEQLAKILDEQQLLEQSIQALKDVKPIIANDSIKQCETLANTALKTIFDLDKQVIYSPEDGKFLLKDSEDNYENLRDSQGGGILTVISFVFNLFLIQKLGAAKFLMFDEAFYAISDAYFPAFMQFMNQITKDLGVDLLLISHDVRIEPEMVNHIYVIENGVSQKVK